MSSEWTAEDILTLLRAMRANAPKRGQPSTYRKELRSLDWENVAFHPHSAQACQKKWQQILQKMRRVRSLTELLDEAEDTFAEPLWNGKIHPELPKRPKPPNAIFCEENFANLQKTHPELSPAQVMKLSNQKYNALPAAQKAQYIKRFKLSTKEYQKNWKEFRNTYNHVKKRRTKTPGLDDGHNNKEDGKTKVDEPPPNPPKNGYVLFCKEAMASSTFPSSSCCEQWKKLSDTQKEEYKTRCKQLKKEYTERMKEYLHDVDEEQPQQSPEKNDRKRPNQGKKRKCFADKERILDKEDQRPTKHRTSDSEDEVLKDSSSDGDTYTFNSDEEEGVGRHPWYCPL